MELLKNYILKQFESNQLSQDEAKKLLLELKDKPDRKENDIAVIGMACKFPDAHNVDEYWSNLKSGVSSIKEPSQIRKDDTSIFYNNQYFTQLMLDLFIPEGTDLNDKYIKGGYLDEIDKFDAGFFRIPPREAKFMEPLQRLFLETAWEAVEDAGYGGNKISGTNTGVYVGRDNTGGSVYQHITEPDQMHLTGSWAGIMATRIQYIFNLRGPGLVVDTACSSGMTATHMACRALLKGDCEMAIAGGIHITLLPNLKDQKSSMDMVESDDDKVRTFDKGANGTVWGEGVGTLILKPLSKALADGDNIHAVIKGSAINNDGASNGITAPNADAQEDVIVKAWKEAKIEPDSISYIEAHGTGTILGDPIEIKGITNAFRRYTDKKQFCGIGSVKTNFGHLVAASGMASIIKVILSLKNKMIPATINFTSPNPYINFSDSPVFVNDKLSKWERENSPRRAAVSSFGFSGTNCHIVLEEAPEQVRRSEIKAQPYQILTLSARSENVLKDLINRYIEFIVKGKLNGLRDICHTANTGRGHFAHRLALVLKDEEDFKEKLLLISRTDFTSFNKQGIYYKEHKIVPGSKKVKEPGEISEEEKKEITKKAELKLKELLDLRNNKNLYEELCRLYVEGANVEWDELYKGQDARRVSIPVYPLERVRYWAAPKEMKMLGEVYSNETEKLQHPLINKLLVDSIDRQIYVTHFDGSRHWELSDHKLLDTCIFPGTGYLELAREACKGYYGSEAVELRDIFFISPLFVRDGEIKDVQTIIKKEKGYLQFTVVSKQESDDFDEEELWTTHTEGKIYKVDDISRMEYNIEDLKNRCNLGESTLTLSTSTGPIKFGTKWDNVDRVFIGENEMLVKLVLPDELHTESIHYNIHPSMMDNAANLSMVKVSEGGLYLPLTYPSMKIYDKMPFEFYSYVRKLENSNHSKETISFDISLMDAKGKVFAELKNYSIKRVHETEIKKGKPNSYYQVNWNPEEVEYTGKKQIEGLVLVLKDEMGIANGLISSLKNSCNDIIEVSFGTSFRKTGANHFEISGIEEDYGKLLGTINRMDISKIIHLSTLTNSKGEDSLASLEEIQKRGMYSLFYLTKALVASKHNKDTDIILFSESVRRVTGKESTLNPHHAAFFGLGKVVSQEYQNLQLRCIDMDQNTTVDELLKEIFSNNKSNNAAFRKNVRYVPVFNKAGIKKARTNMEFKKDGVYIITGGTGGIGLEIARYMASKTNLNLALINRSKLPDVEQWDEILQKKENAKLCQRIKLIRDMEASGSKVVCCSADITIENELKAVIDSLRNKYGKINGIVHSAGVAGDGFIVRKDPKLFHSVITPKVHGTWLLDRLTKDDNLDFFLLFSSMVTLTGGVGQGDYTAANSYLDAFGEYRSSLGKRTLVINWPGWKETGMAFDHGVSDEHALFKSIETAKALNIFEEVLSYDTIGVYPGELNFNIIIAARDNLPIRLSSQIKSSVEKYKHQQKQEKIETEDKNTDKNTSGEVIIKGVSGNDSQSLEYKLAKIWAQVLELSEIDIYENFHDLGGDSILATQLLKEIEKVFPDCISISDIFSYPSVSQLAEFMTARVEAACVTQEELVNEEETKTDKEPETDRIELSSVQRCFFSRSFTQMNHWNECYPFYFKEGFDITALRKVLHELILYHDALRLVIKKEEGRYVQYLKNKEDVWDILYVYHITPDMDIKETMEREALNINTSLDLAEGPLIKVALFKTVEGDYLYLSMHHLIIDGLSINIIIEDVSTGYMQAISGKDIVFAPKTASIVSWANYLNKYAQEEEITREIEYWDKIDETPLEKLPRDFEVKDRRLKNDAHEHLYLLDEIETTKFLMDGCKRYRTNAETILLTALGITLDRWGGMERAHLRLCGNGRDLPFSKIELSRTIGWLSMSYPFVLETGRNLSMSKKVEKVKKALTEIPNKGAGYDILRFITLPQKYPGKTYSVEPEIFFNYMGQYGEPDMQGAYLPILKSVPEKSLESEREYVINIEGSIYEGKLKIHLEYNREEYKRETILAFLEEYKNALADIVKAE